MQYLISTYSENRELSFDFIPDEIVDYKDAPFNSNRIAKL